MIREARYEDIDTILELLKSYSNNTHIDKKYIYKDMKESYSKYLVYEDNNEVLGMINYHNFDSYGEIIDIVVNINHRRKKIGTKLLQKALDNLNNSNVTLEVKEDNKNAIKLYKKLGFEIIQTRKKYYNDKDAYIMQKERK